MELTAACEAFYRERDQRTISYGASEDVLSIPVGIGIGAAAAQTKAGQIAVLALVNMAARIHRRLHIAVPPVPLLLAPLFGGEDLTDAVGRSIEAIDPCNETHFVANFAESQLVSVGIGDIAGARMLIGCEGMLAELGNEPQRVADAAGAVFGSGLAACMGAAALLHLAAGHPVADRRASLWNFADGEKAVSGSGVDRPINVGSVLEIGAGAVGSALCYWLWHIGVEGQWTIADGDGYVLHNTSRTIGATPADAGWPDGASANKAVVAAPLIDAEAFPGWYDEWLAIRDGELAPDLIMPLANARGVRPAIAARGDSLVVHATTGDGWTAELHRHARGQDDCISCRIPEDEQTFFVCATGEVSAPEGESTDAALPFLSAASGLMLARFLDAMSRGEGDLLAGASNHWVLSLGPPGIEVAKLKAHRWPPRDGCTHTPR